MILSKREWYPWYKSHLNSPWKRYLNKDFLSSEVKRINDCNKWYLSYKNANSKLDSVEFYLLPIKMEKSWMEETIGFEVKGLSALYDDLQSNLILLVPKDVPLPPDFSLIRIDTPVKKIIFNKNIMKCAETIIADKIERISQTEKVYEDMPHEKKIINKIFYKSLGFDIPIANSLQAPILSSPGIDGEVKGISFSARMDDELSQDILKIIQIMVPPELRTSLPVDSWREGKWIEDNPGIFFHVAEVPPTSKNKVDSFLSKDYSAINSLNGYRKKYDGEYSFANSILQRKITPGFIKERVEKFSCTDITADYTERIKSGGYMFDEIKKEINEDLWLTIINARQLRPHVEMNKSEETNFLKKLENDWEPFLIDFGYNEVKVNLLKKIFSKKTYACLQRISQSLSRASFENYSDYDLLLESRKIFLDTLNDLWDSIGGNELKKEWKKQEEEERILIIRGHLGGSPLTEEEVWDELDDNEKRYYIDFDDFKKAVRWMEEKSQIYRMGNIGIVLLD